MIKLSEQVFVRYPVDVIAITPATGGSSIYLDRGEDMPGKHVIFVEGKTPSQIAITLETHLNK